MGFKRRLRGREGEKIKKREEICGKRKFGKREEDLGREKRDERKDLGGKRHRRIEGERSI